MPYVPDPEYEADILDYIEKGPRTITAIRTYMGSNGKPDDEWKAEQATLRLVKTGRLRVAGKKFFVPPEDVPAFGSKPYKGSVGWLR